MEGRRGEEVSSLVRSRELSSGEEKEPTLAARLKAEGALGGS